MVFRKVNQFLQLITRIVITIILNILENKVVEQNLN